MVQLRGERQGPEPTNSLPAPSVGIRNLSRVGNRMKRSDGEVSPALVFHSALGIVLILLSEISLPAFRSAEER